MRRMLLTISMAATVLVMCVSASAQKADFSGTWVLDKSRSEGLPPGMEQTITIKQSGDRFDLEVKLTSPQGTRETKDQFVLDGKEVEFKPDVMAGFEVTKGARTPKWSADSKSFDLIEDVMVDGPEGAMNLKAARHWQLSEDGKTLTIDMTVEGPRGVRKSKRVFNRK